MITIKPLTARWATFKLLSSSSRCLSTGKLIQSGKQNEQTSVLDNHESKERAKFDEENTRLKEFAEEFQKSLAPEKLTDLDAYRQPMAPVAKGLFLGQLDPIIFSYPDVLPNDRYYALDKRCKKLNQSMIEKKDLLQETIKCEGRIPKHILLLLRSQGFYGLRSKVEDGGECLTVTEATRLFEELASIDLSLSETVAVPATFGYRAIELFGSDEQKSHYLPKMVSGQWIGAFCMADAACGSDPESTSVRATHIPEEEKFYLTGKKTWVTNGPTADVFTVFANVMCRGEGGNMMNQLTAFLVDRKSPGLTVHVEEREQKVGLKGLETCPVSFNETPVPESNVIDSIGKGSEILLKVLEEQRLSSAARMSSGLKKILDATVTHVLSRKVHGNPIATYELVKSKISDCATHLYALESAIYMAAGLSDYQLEPDVALEYAMTKYFAMKASKVICGHCADLMGNKVYLSDTPIRAVMDDVKSFDWWDTNREILGIYIAISGLSHAGKDSAEMISKVRNPFMYPSEVFKRFRSISNSSKEKPKLVLRLGDHVHPTLSIIADGIETHLLRFGYAVNQMMVNEGYNAILREIDLMRLANIGTELFAMTSMLARSSRSYAGGHEHSEHETHLTLTYVNEIMWQIHNDLEKIAILPSMKNDRNMMTVTDYTIDKGKYSPVHPITKNFF